MVRDPLLHRQTTRLTWRLQVGEWWLQAGKFFAWRNSLCGFAPENELRMARFYGTPKSLPVTELATTGARLSPFEDFKLRTLSAISGLWAKLLYVAELRSEDGNYEHWGHSRLHGEGRSQEALAQAHSELYIELLRTPISELAKELEAVGDENEPAPAARRLAENEAKAVPQNFRGGSPRHFSSVVLAVSLLDSDRRASTH